MFKAKLIKRINVVDVNFKKTTLPAGTMVEVYGITTGDANKTWAMVDHEELSALARIEANLLKPIK